METLEPEASLSPKVSAHLEDGLGLSFPPHALSMLFASLQNLYPLAGNELSVAFLGTEKMCELHGRFLKDASPTDVITFPAAENPWSATPAAAAAIGSPKSTPEEGSPQKNYAELPDVATDESFAKEGSPQKNAELIGEICVNAEQALLESKSRGIEFKNELSLYLVHGWLHLKGLQDKGKAQRLWMRWHEFRALRTLKAKGHLPDFKLEKQAFTPKIAPC